MEKLSNDCVNAVQEMGVKNNGVYYFFSKDELEDLIRRFIKRYTEFNLSVFLGSLVQHPYDVYLTWEEDDDTVYEKFFDFEEKKSKENLSYRKLGLHASEDYVNISQVLSIMFATKQTPMVSVSYDHSSEGYIVYCSKVGLSDKEMAKELIDMGYDVSYNFETNDFDLGLLIEMAINEGYKWDDEEAVWRN